MLKSLPSDKMKIDLPGLTGSKISSRYRRYKGVYLKCSLFLITVDIISEIVCKLVWNFSKFQIVNGFHFSLGISE